MDITRGGGIPLLGFESQPPTTPKLMLIGLASPRGVERSSLNQPGHPLELRRARGDGEPDGVTGNTLTVGALQARIRDPKRSTRD